MVVYTVDQYWEILRDYFENHSNVAKYVRKLRTDFGRREATSALYVRYLVKKVKETSILIDNPKRQKPAIDLQKMPILPKKSSFQMKLILILAGM